MRRRGSRWREVYPCVTSGVLAALVVLLVLSASYQLSWWRHPAHGRQLAFIVEGGNVALVNVRHPPVPAGYSSGRFGMNVADRTHALDWGPAFSSFMARDELVFEVTIWWLIVPTVLLCLHSLRVHRWIGPVKRRHRRAQGLCPTCGYDMSGQADAGCPECGWNRDSTAALARADETE